MRSVPKKPSTSLPHKLRIIGGEWRGRKLDFPVIDAIRPTPDRVRETVFNWLQDHIVGARCLDLFAGSGALGLEALSRGASTVVFVDREPRIAQYLRETLKRLNCTTGEVHSADSLRWLNGSVQNSVQSFDVVFLDPPFDQDVVGSVCQQLEAGGQLTNDAFIYIESAAHRGTPVMPVNWMLIKSKTAGQVGYHLARRNVSQN